MSEVPLHGHHAPSLAASFRNKSLGSLKPSIKLPTFKSNSKPKGASSSPSRASPPSLPVHLGIQNLTRPVSGSPLLPWSAAVSKGLRVQPRSSTSLAAAATQVAPLVDVPAIATPVDVPATATEPSPSSDSDAFVWTKNWYPVAIVEHLDDTRPTQVTLLGKEYVLWHDSKGEWRCFEDRCPHRLAPLSDGWMVGDSLVCSYHGWEFNTQGSCTHVPQLPSKEMEAKIISNKKTCVTSFPVQTRMGLLFVWPESGPMAWIESAASEPNVVPDLEDESITPLSGRWTCRDMPYGWEFFIENVLDSAHVVFSHHGVAGINRHGRTKPVTSEIVEPVHAKGFMEVLGFPDENEDPNVREFRPPCLVKLTIPSKGEKEGQEGAQYFAFYAIPTRPGWVRHIGCTYLTGESKKAKLLSFFTSGAPTWLKHYFAHDFLNGDLVTLNHIDRCFNAEGRDWRKSYYLGAPADASTARFWQWMDTFAGGKIPFAPEVATNERPKMSRTEMLDRYSQHVKNCKSCSGALKNTETMQAAAYIGAFAMMAIAIASTKAAAVVANAAVSAAAAAAVTTTAAPAVPGVVSFFAGLNPMIPVVVSALLLVAVVLLDKFKQGYFSYDFVRPL